ncbi:MAG: restriction endonuclease subunit S [Deltaproteobacteria bacterium]|nr:restriction endonuclease subunit S [Deltaproteobacteria bacterium]
MSQRLNVSLGEVCTIESALVDPTQVEHRSRPHVGGANIVSNTGQLVELKTAQEEELISGKFLFTDADVLYSKIRPYLRKVALPSFAGLCSADIYPLRPHADHLDREYLYYLLLSDEFTEYAVGVSNRAGMPKVNREQLFEFKFRIPTIVEQRRVTRVVRECLDRVDEARELRALSKVEAKALELAMFQDFVMRGMDQHSWPTVALGDITCSSKYGTSAKAFSDAVGCPVLRMSNIVGGYLDLSDLKYVQLPEAEQAKYLLQRGDILINRTNSLELVGKAATFDSDEGEWIYASYLVRIRVDSSRAVPEYVTAVINSRIGREFVLRTARRAIGMVNINAKEMEKFPIPLPPVSVQRAFVERLAEVRLAAEEIRSGLALKDPELLRSAVLRKAFAGEL